MTHTEILRQLRNSGYHILRDIRSARSDMYWHIKFEDDTGKQWELEWNPYTSYALIHTSIIDAFPTNIGSAMMFFRNQHRTTQPAHETPTEFIW